MGLTDERVVWLTARLNELFDLAARIEARYTTRGPYAENPGAPLWPTAGVVAVFRRHDGEPDLQAGLTLIEAFGPDAVLARVEANRRILARHTPTMREIAVTHTDDPTPFKFYACAWCHPSLKMGRRPGRDRLWPCNELRDLLSAHRYAPGFREEWLNA